MKNKWYLVSNSHRMRTRGWDFTKGSGMWLPTHPSRPDWSLGDRPSLSPPTPFPSLLVGGEREEIFQGVSLVRSPAHWLKCGFKIQFLVLLTGFRGRQQERTGSALLIALSLLPSTGFPHTWASFFNSQGVKFLKASHPFSETSQVASGSSQNKGEASTWLQNRLSSSFHSLGF